MRYSRRLRYVFKNLCLPLTAVRVGHSDNFRQVAEDLRQQYVLSYYPPGDARGGRFHAFTLRVRARPDLRVRTRKGYYAPKS